MYSDPDNGLDLSEYLNSALRAEDESSDSDVVIDHRQTGLRPYGGQDIDNNNVVQMTVGGATKAVAQQKATAEAAKTDKIYPLEPVEDIDPALSVNDMPTLLY